MAGRLAMTTSGVLAKQTAKAAGMPLRMVANVLRGLRDAKMIRRGGRGTSAPSMTSEDAAALIVGMAAGVPTPDVAEVARKILGSRHVTEITVDRPSGLMGLTTTPFSELDPRHTFWQGLAALIRDATEPGREDRGSSFRNVLHEATEVAIGLDGMKRVVLAAIRYTDGPAVTTHYYSTLDRRGSAEPRIISALGYELYADPPAAANVFVVRGRPLIKIGRILGGN